MLRAVKSHDEADRELLMLATEKGKFAIDLSGIADPDVQLAFERGIDAEWFTLVDVAPLANGPPGRLFRLFRLTTSGWNRRRELMQ